MTTAAAWLALAGAIVALVGSIGLVRMPTFYQRVHPPTLGTTLGMGLVLAASASFFFSTEGRAPVQELMIAIFMVATTPATYTLLARAALQRGRAPGTEAP